MFTEATENTNNLKGNTKLSKKTWKERDLN